MTQKTIFGIFAILGIAILVILTVTGRFGFGGSEASRSYVSSSFDVGFDYSEATYALEERREKFEDNPLLVVTLTDKLANVPDMSEGPTAISLIAAINASSTPLEQWVRTKSIANFPASGTTLSSTTIAGEPALRYQYSGLYENDVVAVSHDDTVYLFSVSWSDANAQMRQDFETLLTSVTFK